MNRREFLRRSAAGAGFWARARAKSPNERLAIGVVGVSGRGNHRLLPAERFKDYAPIPESIGHHAEWIKA